jgi:O-antigen/teichoic acid export membrane protein
MTRTARTVATTDATAIRRRVTRDSLWLTSGYAATSLSGFAFWLLAAMWIPQSQVGVEASQLAIVMAAAALASNGPGSALVVMLPLGGSAARSALRRAYLATSAMAAVFGAIGGMIVALFLPSANPPPMTAAAIAVSTVAWALFNTQAQALAGASDARGTLLINGGANAVKLGLLAVLAFPDQRIAEPLVVATIVPAAAAASLSMAVLIPRALRRQDAERPTELVWDRAMARTFALFVAQNAAAVGFVMCAGLSLSFFVTTLSSPAEGAVFAIAYQFSVALDLLGVAVATALARSAAAHYSPSARLARGLAVKVAVAVGALGAAATLATPVMFLVVGRGYPPLYGMAVVGILAIASMLRPGYDVWSALVRARHRVGPVLWGNAAYVVILLSLVFVLVPDFGALGAAIAVACGAVALAAIGGVGLHRVRDVAPRILAPEGTPA